MVVYFHAVTQLQRLTGWQVDLPMIGASGVDIFFVLSGFVMYVSTHDRRVTVADFVRRRFVRIVPLYWLLTLTAAGLAALVPSLLRSTEFDPAHVAASLAFVPWLNPAQSRPADPMAISPVIVPGWTLNFEMMFYALFAVSLLVRGERARLAVLTALVAALFAGCSLLGDSTVATRFYASSIMFEFVAGSWLAAMLEGRAGPRSPLLPAMAMAAAFGALLFGEWMWAESLRLVRLGLPAVTIVACAVLIERTGRLGFSRLWDALGNASYSIYLSHIFVVAGLRIALELAGIWIPPSFGVAFVVAAIVLAAALGLLAHVAIEKPLTRAVNVAVRGTRRRRDLPVSVA